MSSINLRSDELMRMLIPDGEIEKYAKVSGLSTSLLYMERRKSGNEFNNTGTRNTIDRLDIFSELTLSRDPNIVRLVGERYLNKYNCFMQPSQSYTVLDLLGQLGEVSRECGEAVSAIAKRASIKNCAVEVAQAKAALEKALAMVAALEDCNE